jgi:uncharacterized repeat protein (TIGR01451 family)
MDISVTKSASTSSATVGTNVTYTIVASNAGPELAGAVTVTDVLPSTLTFISSSTTLGSCSGTGTVTCALGDLAAGASATITLVAKPNATGSIANTASIAATGTEFDTADNTSAAATITATAAASESGSGSGSGSGSSSGSSGAAPSSGDGGGAVPTVKVEMTAGVSPATVPFGGNAAFTFTVKNVGGNETATGISFSNVLPIGAAFVSSSSSQGSCSGTTCSLGSLAPGASATVTIVVQVSVFGSLTNSATVTSANGGAFSASATVTVGSLPTLVDSSPADGSVVASVERIELRASRSVEWSAVSVERPDGSRTGLAGGSGTSISRDFASSLPGAYTVRATMTGGGASVSVTVHFTVFAGTGIAPEVERSVEVNEPGTLTAPGSRATVSWPAAAITEPIILTVQSASASATTFGAGNQVISITAQRTSDGRPVTSFAAPFDIAFPNVPASFVPAVSQDGVTFRQLAQLSSRSLPAGQQDGYYRDGTTVHILTRHLTFFAVLNQANFTVALKLAASPRVNTSRTRTVAVRVSASLASSTRLTLVDAGNRTVATSVRRLQKGATVVTLALPKAIKAGRYTLVAVPDGKAAAAVRQTVVVASRATTGPGRTRVLLAGYGSIRTELARALSPLFPVTSSTSTQSYYRLANVTGNHRLVIVEYAAGGTALIRELRTLFPDVAIIVVTGNPTESRQARAAGADATLQKPVTGLTAAKAVLRLLSPPVS